MNKTFSKEEILQEVEELQIYGGYDVSSPNDTNKCNVNNNCSNNICTNSGWSCVLPPKNAINCKVGA